MSLPSTKYIYSMLPLPSFRSTDNTENSSDSNEFTLNKILVSSLRLNNRNLAEYANASFSVDHFNTLRANYTTQNPCANTSFTANHFANTNKTGTGISAFLDTSMVDFDTRNPETCVLTQLNFSLPLSWHNLSYRIGDRQVLYGLTGTALSGRCLAIMGSSGAGKTTFLNAISDRLPSNKDAKLSGSRKLGDIAYNQAFRKALGFVTQDDIISSMATPYEMLWFALRTRRGTNRRETHERVMGMLSTLKLIESKDTLIGVPGTSASLSGGERKRCSIGAELVCDPKVLLLDEPTSALDSVTSANIIQQLRELARLGSTIIYTIHQPTAEMLSAFDDIMLLTGGRCVYHGTMEDSLGYFESIGFKCPDHYTAGDYFMKLLQDESTARVLIQEWEKYLKSGKRTPHTTSIRPVMRRRNSVALKFIDMYVKKYKSSMFIQFTEVFFRRLNELRRDRAFILALLVQTLYFSFVAGLIFMHLGMDEASIQDRQGLLYTILANRIMGSIYSSLASFHRVHIIFLHDQHSDAYSPFFYFFGTMCAQLPFMFSLSLIESIIVYFLTGLYTSASAFFIYFCIMFVFHGVCVNIGILLSASFESLTLATSMVALINLPFTFASGLFASTDRLRPYFYLFEKLSYIRYAYILLLRNELKHINHIDCDAQRYGELFCRNQPQNGKDVLVQLGFDADPQSTDLIMWLSLILMWILLQISTIVVLMVMSRRKR